MKKRAKFLKRCKLAMCKRWSREYVRSLRKQHLQKGQKQSSHPKIGEVVIVLDRNLPRNRWKLGVVTRLMTERDNVTRGAIVKTGKGTIQRAIQQLYPLELSCDREPRQFVRIHAATCKSGSNESERVDSRACKRGGLNEQS